MIDVYSMGIFTVAAVVFAFVVDDVDIDVEVAIVSWLLIDLRCTN